MLASICAQARLASAVAGTHGKTTTTSMLMLILAEAGLRPSFVVGGDVTDVGTGAQWTGGQMVRRRSRRERRHPSRTAAPRHDPHERRDRPSRSLRLVRRDHRRLRPVPRPDPRPEGGVRRRSDRRAALADRHGAVTYGVSAASMSVRSTSTATTRCIHVHASSADRRAAGRSTSSCRCAECTTSSMPPGPRPWRWRSACDPATSLAALGQVRRCGAAFRHPRRRRRRHVRRRLRASPDRDRGGARRRPRQRRRLAARDRGVPAEPVQPDRRDLARLRATRSSTPTSWCSPTSTRRGPCRSPASPAS